MSTRVWPSPFTLDQWHEIAPGVYETPIFWFPANGEQFVGIADDGTFFDATDPYSRAFEAVEGGE